MTQSLCCCFCGVEVKAPQGFSDLTAKAVCDRCYELGGRLPRFNYQFRVNDQGQPIPPRRDKWVKHFAPNATAATVYTVAIGITAIALVWMTVRLFLLHPMGSALFWALVILIYAAWHQFLRGR